MRVDKTKWKKVMLGDVCAFKSGYTPSADNILEYGKYPYFKVAEMNLPSNLKYMRETTSFLSSDTKRVFPSGAIIFPKNGAAVSTNKKRLLIQDSIVDLNTELAYPTETFLLSYLYYVFLHIDFKSFIKRGAIPTLNINKLKNLCITHPSLPEQRAIAAELDTLQSVIDKLQEQLNDYDKLAQSIFHKMFGDVVNNDKRWEQNKFSKFFALKSGNALSSKNQIEGKYNVYGGNGITGKHNAYNKDGKFVIIGRVGAYCGNVRIVNEKFWLTDNAFEVIQYDNKFDETFLVYLLRDLELGRYANKAAQPVISNIVLKDVPVVLPPLPLQRQFAEQVEAIEAQKALVRQQIADARQLFDSRMQYYFE